MRSDWPQLNSTVQSTCVLCKGIGAHAHDGKIKQCYCGAIDENDAMLRRMHDGKRPEHIEDFTADQVRKIDRLRDENRELEARRKVDIERLKALEGREDG